MFLLLICTGQPPACPTQNVPSLGTIISFMIFPYLSSTPPETLALACLGIYQASGSLPGPWTVLPLRGSHRAFSRRKSHYAVKDRSFTPGAVRLLQASCRSCLAAVFALAADVAPLHRFVPDECVFSFQGAFFSLCVTNRLLRVIFQRRKSLLPWAWQGHCVAFKRLLRCIKEEGR